MSLKAELSKIFGKVYEEDQGEYKLYILHDRGEPRFILCVEKIEGFIVGKITLFSKSTSTDCYSLEYQPEGLYIIASSDNELIGRLRDKINRLVLLE